MQRLGVVTEKSSPDLTMVVHLTSPDNRYDMLYLSNYADQFVKDELARINGVGQVRLFGAGEFSMRVWLDPNKLAALQLNPGDVAAAIADQNQQAAAGSLGAQPTGTSEFQLLINVRGRLKDEAEFENIIVKSGENGEITRLKDVARIELGSEFYALRSLINNNPAAAVPVFQAPGSNAIQISDDVRARMAELSKAFPEGLEYEIAYDPTVFVRGSIEAVISTLLEAVLLVVLVVVLGIIAVAQLARVYELTSSLRNKKEEEISHANNKFNAGMMLAFLVLFFGFFAYLVIEYADQMLPVAASAHGAQVDTLLDANWILIIAVFAITHILLLGFAAKYYHRPGTKATFFPHDNKLELIWTVIPSIVLFFFIFFGLKVWNDITEPASEDAIVVEIYSKQFDWTARFAGNDGKVGQSTFNLISATNPLGLVTKESVDAKIEELNKTISDLEARLESEVMGERMHEEQAAK